MSRLGDGSKESPFQRLEDEKQEDNNSAGDTEKDIGKIFGSFFRFFFFMHDICTNWRAEVVIPGIIPLADLLFTVFRPFLDQCITFCTMVVRVDISSLALAEMSELPTFPGDWAFLLANDYPLNVITLSI